MKEKLLFQIKHKNVHFLMRPQNFAYSTKGRKEGSTQSNNRVVHTMKPYTPTNSLRSSSTYC